MRGANKSDSGVNMLNGMQMQMHTTLVRADINEVDERDDLHQCQANGTIESGSNLSGIVELLGTYNSSINSHFRYLFIS